MIKKDLGLLQKENVNGCLTLDLSKLYRPKSITTRIELLAFANAQHKEGKTDLCEFVFNKSQKVIAELMRITWEMENIQADLERSRLQRLTILERALEELCQTAQAKNLLWKNDILQEIFSTAVLKFLQEDRGKYKNLMLLGPANYGKTFLLGQIPVIYRVLTNLASTSFTWVGAENAEIIL